MFGLVREGSADFIIAAGGKKKHRNTILPAPIRTEPMKVRT